MEEVSAMNEAALLLRLIIAHLLADFLFQRTSWVKERPQKHWKSGKLYLHVLIVGLLTYLFSGIYHNFWIPLFVMVTHYTSDLLKSYTGNSVKYFVLDQLFHLLVIMFAWYFYLMPDLDLWMRFQIVFNNPGILVVVTAYLFIIWPSGYLIAKITSGWQEQIDPKKGLPDAGRWIGMIERILILTFVLINQFTGIGFLIAAKSILRFGDIKNPDNRKEAEYILLGTMISFIIAIFTGLLARYYLAV
ncbi:MAG: DUF3307 domain-containing protein [Bacteroidales bacterium]